MSKNDKRELINWDKFAPNFLENLHHNPAGEPKLTCEFGFYHEYFLRQIYALERLLQNSNSPFFFELSFAVGKFLLCKKEYESLMEMKEIFEYRINQAIDDIDELLPDISDETVANKLKQIKQNLWQTGENRWIEIFWNIERNTNELKIG